MVEITGISVQVLFFSEKVVTQITNPVRRTHPSITLNTVTLPPLPPPYTDAELGSNTDGTVMWVNHRGATVLQLLPLSVCYLRTSATVADQQTTQTCQKQVPLLPSP